MRYLSKTTRTALLAAIWTIATSGVAFAVSFDTPDSAVNPQSGAIETADPVWDGTNQDIAYVVQPGDVGRAQIYSVSDDPADDLAPKIAIGPGGDSWVVWWRDGTEAQIVVRKRTFAGNTWGDERLVSDPGEDSRKPSIVHDGTAVWVGYEFTDGAEISIGVLLVIDEPDPIGIRAVVGTTDFSGDRDVKVSAQQGNLWATWVDDEQYVGWAEYDYQGGTWNLPGLESYAADTVDDARDRVRAIVLGND